MIEQALQEALRAITGWNGLVTVNSFRINIINQEDTRS
jgi:hypothetical protein